MIINNLNELIEQYKVHSPSTTTIFERWLENNARNIPIRFVDFNPRFQKIPAVTNEQGVFLNKQFPITINNQLSYFIIIHEIKHYLDFIQLGEKIYDNMDDSFEDFFKVVQKTEESADAYAVEQLRQINREAGNDENLGMFVQPFHVLNFLYTYQNFLKPTYDEYITNKQLYKNYGEYQTINVLGEVVNNQ